ncbi:hypothetical protein FGG08_003585 [Glutinoglossum americanum]|uniref:Uncharacterized protein n=1 Tax=Glutinoglossum americanum TaxID=1670608 RepID=A0A9P8IAR2_9PEZI|nr:hypothetical protein FGG08_003585 [Glutinoglossum americanum]
MFYSAFRCGVLLAFAGQLWLGPSAAHMVMAEPPSINYKTNPNVAYGVENYDYTMPLSSSGSDYPCKGELKYLGSKAAASVANYSPGGAFTIRIDGEATHAGGSCQASLSYDKGSTFTVIKSWIGDCPHSQPGSDQTFTGQIPSNAPAASEVIFAWYESIFRPLNGRRQPYEDNSPDLSNTTGNDLNPRAGPSGPPIFLANIGNGCSTVASKDVVFPNPGSVVQYGGNAGNRASPSGVCNGQRFTGGAITGGDSSGMPDGSNGDPSGHRGDCSYWASQGYLCSGSPSGAIGPFSIYLMLLLACGLVAYHAFFPAH